MYCKNCGKELPEDAKFCVQCGIQVERKTIDVQNKEKAVFPFSYSRRDFDYVYLKCTKCGEELFRPKNFFKFSDDGDKVYLNYSIICPTCKSTAPRYSSFSKSNPEQFDGLEVPQGGSVSSAQKTDSDGSANSGRRCPKCGGEMNIQTVSESTGTGCFTVILYIILALTVIGLFILIPLALRKKTETVTYAVCQNCGYKERIDGQ